MDKSKAIKIAKKYIDTVTRTFPVESAILFGSYAKGTYNEDSDIDLAIIFKSVDDIIDRQIELMKMRTNDDLMIEPHPFLLSDFEATDPVVYEIMKYGIDIIN